MIAVVVVVVVGFAVVVVVVVVVFFLVVVVFFLVVVVVFLVVVVVVVVVGSVVVVVVDSVVVVVVVIKDVVALLSELMLPLSHALKDSKHTADKTIANNFFIRFPPNDIFRHNLGEKCRIIFLSEYGENPSIFFVLLLLSVAPDKSYLNSSLLLVQRGFLFINSCKFVLLNVICHKVCLFL